MMSRSLIKPPFAGREVPLHTNAASRRTGGFTIVELLMVLGILVVLTSVTLPSILRWQRGLSMEQGISTLQIQLQETRLAAIRSGEAWKLVLPHNQNPGRRQAVRDTAAVDIRRQFHWPAGLKCSELSTAISTLESDQPTRVVCQPDGTVSDCQLQLTDSNENQTQLRIDRLTGMASVIQPVIAARQLTVNRELTKLHQGQTGSQSPPHASKGLADHPASSENRLAGDRKGIHQ